MWTHNPCMGKNITISVDESLVAQQPGQAAADELLKLMKEHGGRSGGRKICRDELYDGRVG